MDGLGRLPGRFRQRFVALPVGAASTHFIFFACEDFENAANERGFPNARPTSDDQHLLLARLPDRLLLPGSQLDPQLAFDPGDGLLHVNDRHGVRRGRCDPVNGLGKADLGPVEGRKVEPGFALDRFSDDRLLCHRRFHGRFDNQLIDLDQFRGMFDDARLGVADVALARQILERVLDGGSGPIGTIAVDSHLGGEFVGGLEADSPDVVGQPVRVFLDLGDGFLAVGPVDADGPARTDAVFGQEQHDFADFLLLLPALANPLDPLVADALDMKQEVRGRLEDFEGAFLVDADDLGGDLRPDAADCPGGQILFNAFRRGRVGRLEFVGLELLAVFPIHDPLAGGFQMLTGRNRGRTSNDRDQILTAFDDNPENGEPVFGIMVGHTLDQAGQSFGHGLSGEPWF